MIDKDQQLIYEAYVISEGSAGGPRRPADRPGILNDDLWWVLYRYRGNKAIGKPGWNPIRDSRGNEGMSRDDAGELSLRKETDGKGSIETKPHQIGVKGQRVNVYTLPGLAIQGVDHYVLTFVRYGQPAGMGPRDMRLSADQEWLDKWVDTSHSSVMISVMSEP